MAQAAGLYLFSLQRYRQWDVRNRVNFLIPGPLKICKKSIVPYGREKIQYYVTERENQNGASRRSVSLSFPRYRQWNVRNRVKCLISEPLKICKISIVPYGREKIPC